MSDHYREAVEVLLVLPQYSKDITELESAEYASQKTLNCHMFVIVLNNLRVLVHKELVWRCDSDESNSNFVQLLHLYGLNCDVEVDSWLARKTHRQLCKMNV